MTPRAARALALAAAALLGAAGCERVHAVRLRFASTAQGVSGFRCRAASTATAMPMMMGGMMMPPPRTEPLAARISRDGHLAVLVDFISLNNVGLVPADQGALTQFCRDAGCAPVAAARVCFDHGPLTAGQTLGGALAAMAGTLVSADAPDGLVVARVVGTTQRCSELRGTDAGALPSFDADRLVGCAVSAPVVLDEVQGDVQVALSSFTADCEPQVRVCASTLGETP